jgi:RimJ/RimL family protein N-acetyltransferase
VTLEGRYVRLEPLSLDHHADLCEAGLDDMLSHQAEGSGRAIGGTRFGNIDRGNRRLEIGWTWIGLRWQRTAVNTEAKHLVPRHAFETLGAMRVEPKTDSLNERSRRAILRLGAVEKGTFRKHMVTESGRVRHTVYFSIVDEEWPGVKARLAGLGVGAAGGYA